MKYNIKKEVKINFTEAVEKIKAELAKEGFGVLTEIDVKTTMKKKLDLDYENYLILGACNPILANRALSAEKEIGLFLPCNVIVYQKNDKVIVSAIAPKIMMEIIDNEEINQVAIEAEERLKRVIEGV